ncbi:phosphotransferase [Clostridium beijerinckii]|uniref:phosphotransferase n=1 Tax=Clostridium beijerinckii TaxID=1520 RepID=UPI0022E61B2C|nr:hypothetical protein [Clostridium beijerinckii]
MKKCIEQFYNITILAIEPAKRGCYGETWKLVSKECWYFVKIDYLNYHKTIYRDNLAVVEYLYNNGIKYINQLIKTRDDKLYVDFQDGILAVFNYVPGENIKSYDLGRLFNLLAGIYTVPINCLDIDKEDFTTGCADYVLNNINEITLLRNNQQLLQQYADRLQIFTERCRGSFDNFYITHGDSGGNIIIDGNNLTIIDWDHAKVAAPERDAWPFINNTSDIDKFNENLWDKGINYKLQKDRLAFYCYYSYFYYLQDYILSFYSFRDIYLKNKLVKYMKHYFFRGWIKNHISQIENLCNANEDVKCFSSIY